MKFEQSHTPKAGKVKCLFVKEKWSACEVKSCFCAPLWMWSTWQSLSDPKSFLVKHFLLRWMKGVENSLGLMSRWSSPPLHYNFNLKGNINAILKDEWHKKVLFIPFLSLSLFLLFFLSLSLSHFEICQQLQAAFKHCGAPHSWLWNGRCS